jgi:ABC-2 type transport system permease protein
MLSRYTKTMTMSAGAEVRDSPLFLLNHAMRFLRIAVMLALWRAIFAGRGMVGGMTVESVLTYALIAEVFEEPLACRTRIESALWEGTIATRLLRPMGLVGAFAAEMAGTWVPGLVLVSLPLLLLAPALGVRSVPASAACAVAFPLSLALAIVAGIAVDFLFGAFIVTLNAGVWIIDSMRTAVTVLLSGALIPIALLPWGIDRVVDWLPFAATASAPLRIFTGTGDPLVLLARQAFWCMALCAISSAVWRRTRERMASLGG